MVSKQQSFSMSIEELHATGCQAVPERGGVYYVLFLPYFEVSFCDTLPTEHPHYAAFAPHLSGKLREKFLSGDRQTLYIGKSQNLRSRIQQLVDLAYGEGFAHRGGRALWQIYNIKKLMVSWEEHNEAQSEKARLLNVYYHNHGVLPLANWQRPRAN